jgi:hypothetical protein
MSKLHSGPPIDASNYVSVHLAKRFQRRRFLEIDQSEKNNCLLQPCLLMDRDEMGNRYRGPSIDNTYQVSVHLAQWFQRRRCFRNQPIRNKHCLWWPCLLMKRDEMSNLHRGLSKDAFYQVSVHLAKRFQRRRMLKISQSETRVAYGGHLCDRIGTK